MLGTGPFLLRFLMLFTLSFDDGAASVLRGNRFGGFDQPGGRCTPIGMTSLFEFEGKMLVNLNRNKETLTNLQIQILEDALVESYNAIAGCEQSGAIRLLREATLLEEEIQDDATVLNLIQIIGFCNSCVGTGMNFFEPEQVISSIVNPLLPFMTTEDDAINTTTPCECDGPSRTAFNNILSAHLKQQQLQYGDLPYLQGNHTLDITQAEIFGILDPETNNITSFETEVVIRMPVSILQATPEEIEKLEEAFLIGYNRANNQNQLSCDPLFRTISDVAVDLGIFALEQGGRVLQQNMTTDFPPTTSPTTAFGIDIPSPTASPITSVMNDTQINTTSTPTATPQPTQAPTTTFSVGLIDVPLLISGTCLGCPSDQNLFDQVMGGRRHRQVEMEEEGYYSERLRRSLSSPRTLQRDPSSPVAVNPQGGVKAVFQVVDAPTCPSVGGSNETGAVGFRGPTIEEFLVVFVDVEVNGTIPAQDLGAVCLIIDKGASMNNGACLPGFEMVLGNNVDALFAGENYAGVSSSSSPSSIPSAFSSENPSGKQLEQHALLRSCCSLFTALTSGLFSVSSHFLLLLLLLLLLLSLSLSLSLPCMRRFLVTQDIHQSIHLVRSC